MVAFGWRQVRDVLLVHRVGLTDTEVAGMPKDEAVDRLRWFWSGGTRG